MLVQVSTRLSAPPLRATNTPEQIAPHAKGATHGHTAILRAGQSVEQTRVLAALRLAIRWASCSAEPMSITSFLTGSSHGRSLLPSGLRQCSKRMGRTSGTAALALVHRNDSTACSSVSSRIWCSLVRSSHSAVAPQPAISTAFNPSHPPSSLVEQSQQCSTLVSRRSPLGKASNGCAAAA